MAMAALLSPAAATAFLACGAKVQVVGGGFGGASGNGWKRKVVRRRRGAGLLVQASGDPLGDFGGRDPFPAEIASNFGDKVIGFGNTEHNILIPTLTILDLAEKSVKPLAEGAVPLTEDEAKALLRKVVGWRLSRADTGALKLQSDMNLKDSASVSKLISLIGTVGDAENYQPETRTLENNKVQVELWTPLIGGLSENDFIIAAKIDKIDMKDLRKVRAWF